MLDKRTRRRANYELLVQDPHQHIQALRMHQLLTSLESLRDQHVLRGAERRAIQVVRAASVLFTEGVNRSGLQRRLCSNQIAERNLPKLAVELKQTENPIESASLNKDIIGARPHSLFVEEWVFIAVDHRIVVFAQQDSGGILAEAHSPRFENADLLGDGFEFLQCTSL